MKTNTVLILAFSILFLSQLSGQNPKLALSDIVTAKVDSLWIVYRQTKQACQETCIGDTVRLKLFLEFGVAFYSEMPDSAIAYYDKAAKLADKILTAQVEQQPDKQMVINLKKHKSKSLFNTALVHYNQGRSEDAINFYSQALQINEEFSESSDETITKKGLKGMSGCFNSLGIVYYDQGIFDKAIEYYTKCLKIKEQLNDKFGMAYCYNNLGLVHSDKGGATSGKAASEEFNLAFEYYNKSIILFEEIGNRNGVASCYNNFGIIYDAQGNYDKATEYYLKALKIREETGDKNGIAMVYGNLASLNYTLADSASLSERQRVIYLNEAVRFGLKMYEIACEIGAIPYQNGGASELKKAYNKLASSALSAGNFKLSTEYFQEAIKFADIFIATKDSMFSEEKTKALAEMGTKYEAEKKQLQIEKMSAQKSLDDKTMEAQHAENRKQQIIIISAIAGFIVVFLFSIIIFRMFRQKRKANILLAQQNEEIIQQKEEISSQRDEIETQRDKVQDQKEQIEGLYNIAVERKELVEAQKEEIEDSIIYAKRIQTAVLPSEKYANSILGDHFIIFRPKDVVSGDFYWATVVNEWLIVAATDCTGHGVPGAFMSMLGVSFLNEIVRKKEVTNAAEILNHLRSSVIDALKQSAYAEADLYRGAGKATVESGSGKSSFVDSMGVRKSFPAQADSEVKDGMDMSIIAIKINLNPLQNPDDQIDSSPSRSLSPSPSRKALWAGANNPLYIIKKHSSVHPCLGISQDSDENHSSVHPCLGMDKLQSGFKDKPNPIPLLLETKGDKQPVAIHIKMEPFTNHEIQLEHGDKIYLFTDGFPDQFGGPKGKKYKHKSFKELIARTATLSMKEQGLQMEKELDMWMNSGRLSSDQSNDQVRTPYEQVDDITVVGMEI